jgi:hypothetical protein
MQSMRSRRSLLFAALAALAAMAFAQAALALASCDFGPGGGMPMHAGASEEAAAPCHPPAEAENLCAAHCRNNDQARDKPQVKVPVAAAVESVAQLPFVPRARPTVTQRPAPLPAGPPPRILFQSFLI